MLRFRTLLSGAAALALLLPVSARAESLESALKRLLTNDHGLTAGGYEMRAINADSAAAAGAMEPQVTLSGRAGPEWFHSSNPDPGDRASQAHMTGSAAVDLDYNLYDAGLREARLMASEQNHILTRLDRELRAQNLMLDGIMTYAGVLESRHLAELATAHYRRAGAQLSYESKRAEQGEGTAVDVNYAVQRRQQVARRKAELEGEARRTLLRYANLFQQAPDLKRMKLPAVPVERLPKSIDEARAFAREESVQMTRSSKEIGRASALAAATEAAAAPQLSAYGRLGHDVNVSGSSDDETRAGAGLKLSWTAYDGGTNAALQRAANERVAAAHARTGQTHDDLMDKVNAAYISWETANARLKLAKDGVRSVRALLGQRRAQLTEGKIAEGAVLDAEATMAAAALDLAQAEAGQRAAGFRLLAATGRLTPESFGLALPVMEVWTPDPDETD